MKLLPTVIAFILVLSALSYARYENFFQNQTLRFTLSQNQEHAFPVFNALQHKMYAKHHKTTEITPPSLNPIAHNIQLDEIEEHEQQQNLCSFLDLAFFKEPTHSPNDAEWQQRLSLLTKLLHTFYANTPFFQETKKIVPDLEQSIAQHIVNTLHNPQKPAQTKRSLNQLSFPNPHTHDAYHLMLLGSQNPNNPYPPLLDHITVHQKNPRPISVYLAPKYTLLVLFQNETIVQDLLNERSQIHKQMQKTKQRENKKEFETLLQQKFAPSLAPDVPLPHQLGRLLLETPLIKGIPKCHGLKKLSCFFWGSAPNPAGEHGSPNPCGRSAAFTFVARLRRLLHYGLFAFFEKATAFSKECTRTNVPFAR